VSLEVSDPELAGELESVAEENASWEPADDRPPPTACWSRPTCMAGWRTRIRSPTRRRGPLRHRARLGAAADQRGPAGCPGRRAAGRRAPLPDDDADPRRAGKIVRYTIDVTALKRKVRPAIDDELAKTLGYDSLDGLKERVAEVLRSNKRRQRREQWRRALLDHLEAAIDVNELPPSLVSSAVREDLSRFAYTMAMQGVEPSSTEINWQEMAARMEPGSRRRVLDMLVLEQLADEWQIAVPESDVDAYVSLEARQRGSRRQSTRRTSPRSTSSRSYAVRRGFPRPSTR